MGYSCSADAVRKAMASIRYHKRRAQQKFKVRPENRPKRVQWCQQQLHWTREEWFHTVFSDDHPDYMDEREQSGRKVIMVQGAFCCQMKTDLVFVPQKVSVDSATYTEYILDPSLIPFWHKTCEAYGWTRVVEDNTPGHKKYAIACRYATNLKY